jgi:hypothetical protein
MTQSVRSWSYSSEKLLKSERCCYYGEGLPSSFVGMRADVLTAVSNGIMGLRTVAPCRWVARCQFRRNMPLPSSSLYF